jgi:quinol monooxygenase YgiN
MELTIEMRAKPGKFQELYQTLQALLPTIRKEKGCSDCRIWRDVEDGDGFFISVIWQARARLEHYMRSASGAALLGAIDLLSETAKVRFSHDSPWEGIDSLRRMRKKP